MAMIEVKNLVKEFTYFKKPDGLWGSVKSLFVRKKLYKRAVDDISFSIEKGEFVGFVGQNGAGKTTTLKLLTGILYPTSGEAIVAGFIPGKRKDAFKKKISIVMGQKSQVNFILPPIETFNLFQKIYEIPYPAYKRRLNELSKLLDVFDVLHVQLRKLSLGQRMKCELIASLLHRPEVLFLDEPTIGLDVVSQKKIRDFLREYNRKYKTTIILTSHYMDDVEDLCKRLILIDRGKIGYDGSLKEIIRRFSQNKRVFLQFSERVLKKDLRSLGNVVEYSLFSVILSISEKNFKSAMDIIVNKLPVKDITIHDVTLEEVVSEIFSKGIREEAD